MGIEGLREQLGKRCRKICLFLLFFFFVFCFVFLFPFFNTGGYMETEAAAQESLGLGKLGTQAEKDRRLKKKWVPPLSFLYWLILESNVSFCVVFMQMYNERQDHLLGLFITYHVCCFLFFCVFFPSANVFKAAYKI